MKKLIYFGLLLLTVLLIPSCEDEEVETPRENGSVVFSFISEEPSTSDKTDPVKSNLSQKGIEDAVAILISIESAGGISLYQQHRMDLINVNGHYLTSPVSLSPGNYSITEFIVIDESNNAIYLTPQEGSAYAAFVNNPLPVSFTVTTNLVENVNLEVVGTENATPEDFGYASFSFTIVGDGTFGVSASVYNSAIPGMELTEATMVLSADGTELLTETLGAETNFFPIPGSYTTYTIEISKEGYTTVTKDFTRSELNALGNNPYNAVLLNPDDVGSFTFVTDQAVNERNVVLNLSSVNNLKYTIDWGDGTSEVFESGSDVSHYYSEQREYIVTVTGNIEVIDGIFIFDFNKGLKEVDLSKLISLKTFMATSSQLTSLDLSSNTELTRLFLGNNQLTSIDVSFNTELTELIINDNQLTNIDISSNTELTKLDIHRNQLTSIDLTSNTKLIDLLLSDNQLTNIDLSFNTELTRVWLYNNQLTSIDASSNTKLIELLLSVNQLTNIDLSFNTELTRVGLYNNQLTSIDTSSNTKLIELLLSDNQLTNIDLSFNTELTRIWLGNNQLTSVNVSNNVFLKELIISNNLINNVVTMESIYNQILTNVEANNIVDGRLDSYGNDIILSQTINDISDTLINDYNWSVWSVSN